MSAVDQLSDEIRDLVWEGDAETVVRMLELTRNLNTAIELENQALRAAAGHLACAVEDPEPTPQNWRVG